jgi:hypothetical protein
MKQVAGHFDGHGPPTGQHEQLVAREFGVRTKLAEPRLNPVDPSAASRVPV